MGFLDRIFNNKKDIKQEDIQEVKSVMIDDNPILYYKNKYEGLERQGKKIEWWEFQQSLEKGWPYPVATEGERRILSHLQCQTLNGHVKDVSNALYYYSNGLMEDADDTDYTVYKDADKVKFWKDFIIDRAENGDVICRAALITDLGIYGGIGGGWQTPEEHNFYKEKYENDIITAANNNDPLAMYAVAEYCLGNVKYGSDLRRTVAENAMDAGVGDAAFLMGEIYESDIYTKGGEYDFGEKIRFYVKGVDANNGAMLGYMQDCIADAYKSGEYGFEKNKDLAIYYYTKAIANGYEDARQSLTFMKEHPEIYGL